MVQSSRTLQACWAFAVWMAAGTPIAAQAAFVEEFDSLTATSAVGHGPESLVADGWQFRNQSAPAGTSDWTAGTFFTPQSGGGYLSGDSLMTDYFGGTISSWLILPELEDLQAGDLLTLHTRRVASSNDDRLQVRYSPSGGTGTGSGAMDLGDFTELLVEIDPSTGGWVPTSVEVPGSGALAIRYFEPWACNFACPSSSLGIDRLSIGDAPAPPCKLPPTPIVGQSVTWPATQTPYEICNDFVVPEGATVLVEPGCVLQVEVGRSLVVEGTLVAQGAAGAPVELFGGISTVTPPLLISGSAELSHVVSNGRIHVDHGGALVAVDCEFPGQGQVSTHHSIGGGTPGTFVSVERCSFDGNGLAVTDGTLAITDCDFVLGAGVQLLRGYLRVDGVNIDGAQLSIIRERYTQPALLDGLTIVGNMGPALDLYGWNFALGANNVLQGNQVPVQLRGGLVEGSVVPASGNVLNHVDVLNGATVGQSTWPAVDVPYVATGMPSTSAAHLTIGPGADVRFGPGAGLSFLASGLLQARGLPSAPITLRGLESATAWGGISIFSSKLAPRLEHCVVEGAVFGFIADDSLGQVDSCVFEGNQTGVKGTTYGILRARGTRFVDNGIAADTTATGVVALNGATNANSFLGNGMAVQATDSLIDARENWWGSASGPQAPANPGGSGDPVSGLVDFSGFLASAPDAGDHAPVVRMHAPSSLMEAGSVVVLSWEVEDDGAIESQRVLFSEHGPLAYAVVADLPGWQRSLELTVPTAHPSSNISPSFIKIVAVDNAGQEGFEEHSLNVPYLDDVAPATLEFTSDLSGPFGFGEKVDVTWNYSGPSGTWGTAIVLGVDRNSVPYGGATTLVSSWSYRMPYASTDQARILLAFTAGAGGRTHYFYSEPFSVRPDPRLGDAPPSLTLTSPPTGAIFAGGDVVPLAWTADDDEGLRSFSVQASYDEGRTWFIVAEELAPQTRAFGWELAGSAGLEARVRVAAIDRRFQNASDDRAVTISAGPDTACQPNLGFGGPGTAILSVCGDELTPGAQAMVQIQGAPASATAFLIAGLGAGALPFAGGTIVPQPASLLGPLVTDAAGSFEFQVTAPGANLDAFLQGGILDPAQPEQVALTNAIRVELLP